MMAAICTVNGQIIMRMQTDQNRVNVILSGSDKVTIDWGEGKPQTSTVGKNTKFSYKYKTNTKHTITITGNYIPELNCDNNELTSLDVTQNAFLTSLSCEKNKLSSLDVSNNKVLRDLLCDYNQLTSLDISENTALIRLWCKNNQLTILDTSKNPNLSSLICNYNKLTSLDLSNNPALKQLGCLNNQLSDSALNELLRSLPINEQGIELAPDYTIKNRENVPEYCIDRNPGTASCDMSIMNDKGWLRITVR